MPGMVNIYSAMVPGTSTRYPYPGTTHRVRVATVVMERSHRHTKKLLVGYEKIRCNLHCARIKIIVKIRIDQEFCRNKMVKNIRPRYLGTLYITCCVHYRKVLVLYLLQN